MLNKLLNSAQKTTQQQQSINRLQRLSGDGYIQVNNTGGNLNLRLNIQALRRLFWNTVLGGSSERRGDIVRCPAVPNEEAPSGSEDFLGYAKYRLRVTNVTEWTAGAYEKDTIRLDTFDNLAYIVTADPVTTNTGLAPHENLTEWEVYPEIEIEHVEGFETMSPLPSLLDFSPRFAIGENVPYKSRVIPGNPPEVRYYIDKTFQYNGTDTEKSIAQTGTNNTTTSSVYK